MADQVNLKAEKRDDMGSAAVGRLRRGGKIPGVVYGSTQDSYAVQIEANTIKEILRNSASQQILVNLQIEGAKEANKLALIQDIQQHSISGEILHIDFNAVKEDSEIHARVPIELTGEPVGIKQGGILDTLLHDIEVHCLPKDLPATLQFDVSGLDIGDSLSIASAEFPEGVSASLEGEVLIAIVNETRAAMSEGDGEAEEGEGEE
ncbi:MAG TPA: 50S ribosomal protein L25, partial [Verrucomicrobiales bacterium]|nr:50S ribosomal protein L25 [Verrucomicrobiales bacterium]